MLWQKKFKNLIIEFSKYNNKIQSNLMHKKSFIKTKEVTKFETNKFLFLKKHNVFLSKAQKIIYFSTTLPLHFLKFVKCFRECCHKYQYIF